MCVYKDIYIYIYIYIYPSLPTACSGGVWALTPQGL